MNRASRPIDWRALPLPENVSKHSPSSLRNLRTFGVNLNCPLRWDKFIFSHHYQFHTSFHDSWIARHPRRTIEAFNNQYLEAKFIDDNPLPRDASLSELKEWFKPLLEIEDAAR